MSESNATQIVLLVMVVVVLSGLMLSTRRRLAQSKGKSPLGVRQQYDQLQCERKTVRDVEQVMLELDQLARQVHGRLDTRLAKLEALIRDADSRIDTLSRLMREADGAPTIDLTLDEVGPTTSGDGEATGPAAEVDERYDDIYRLADGGLSARRIADETNRTTGEVELILSLRRTKERTDKPLPAASTLPAPSSK